MVTGVRTAVTGGRFMVTGVRTAITLIGIAITDATYHPGLI